MYQETIMFSEREEIFRQKTGKEFTTLYQKYYPKLIYFTNKICNLQKKFDFILQKLIIVIYRIVL